MEIGIESSPQRESLPLSPGPRVALTGQPLFATLATYFAAANFFVGAAFKFLRLEVEFQFFAASGLPKWMISFVGYGEIAIGLLLLPRLGTTIGSIAGMALMAGALASVLANGWLFLLPLPTTTAVALLYAGWHRRDALVSWLQRTLPNAETSRSVAQRPTARPNAVASTVWWACAILMVLSLSYSGLQLMQRNLLRVSDQQLTSE